MYTDNPLGSLDNDNSFNKMPLFNDITDKSKRFLTENSRLLLDPLKNNLKTKL